MGGKNDKSASRKSGKVAGIIPARYASTRFPGKMLHQLAGKPLVQHAWERARRARLLDTVIIATDDMRIAEVAFDFGAEVALTREGHPSGSDRIAEVAARLDGTTHVINLQGDEPALPPQLIDRLARDLLDHPERQMNTAARLFQKHEDATSSDAVKVVVDRNGDALYFSRALIPHVRDGGHAPSLLHLGIYGYRKEILLKLVSLRPSPLEKLEKLEQLRALENGIPIRVLKTAHRSSGIDTPADAKAFERQLK